MSMEEFQDEGKECIQSVGDADVDIQGVPKTVPEFYFCDNFHKYTPVLIICSLLEQAFYDA